MMIPRPCALRSEVLNSVKYYVGDGQLTYGITDNNDGIDDSLLGMLSENT